MNISPETTLPTLLKSHPGARQVLDKYGLRGCGGADGPEESLQFFARAHEVPLTQLLTELKTTAAIPVADSRPSLDALADGIYRRFFKAGIAVVLTAGASWGAFLLLRIASAGAFTEVGLHHVNAHGHAQIFGWVGLFVMGFAYQAFPRFKHTSLRWPQLAATTLVMMLAAIVLRSISEPLVAAVVWTYWLVLLGAVIEVLAAILFCTVIAGTFSRSAKPLVAYDYYIISALGWFVIQAVYDACYVMATLNVGSTAELVALVRIWQAPLRDLQIHGFALLMILGVSQRVFHHFYGLPSPSGRLALALIAPLNLAVAGEAIGLVLMHKWGHVWGAMAYLSAWVIMICCAALVWDWKIVQPAPDHDRTVKYLRAAYVWLFVSMTMLLAMPVYLNVLLPAAAPDSEAAKIGFSHAYYGATRHAITVGFISLMIMGVAAKIVPTLSGIAQHRLVQLWGPFVLVNLGCALRVGGQTATDFAPAAFGVAGISGLFEVTGLAIWGVHLWRIMNGKRPVLPESSLSMRKQAGELELSGKCTVAEVLDEWPQLADVFVAYGFVAILDRRMRETLGRIVTLEKACRRMGVDLAAFLRALNASIPQDRISSADVQLTVEQLRTSPIRISER